MHILIVDAEKGNYQAIQQVWAQADPTSVVTWAATGDEALTRLSAGGIDLVLLADSQTLRQVLAAGFDAPVVFMAAPGHETEIIEALELGAQDYLLRDAAGHYLKLLPTLSCKAQHQGETHRLFQVEQHQRQEADTLRAAALALTTALDQNEVIERILAQLQQVVPYDTCSVQLLRTDADNGHERLEIVGGRGFPNLSEIVGLSFTMGGDNPNTTVVRSRAPLVVTDASILYNNFSREPRTPAHIHSWLGVPMVVGTRLLGMIALDKHESDFYTPEHTRLAEAFAAQSAIAIENAQLYEAERRRVRQLAAVSQVARKAASILNSNRLLQEIVTAIQESFGYFYVALLQLDETTNQLEHQTMAGGLTPIARPDYHQPVGVGLIGWAAQTGQSLLVNDVRHEPRYIRGFSEETPTRAELCVPFKIEGRVMGVLDVHETRVNAFDETDVMALEILADQMAVAIENARLYEQAHQDAQTTSVLLNEVNHRVKNNLTGIIGLLYAARNYAQVDDQDDCKVAQRRVFLGQPKIGEEYP